jgi:osmotically-inducible protein OsmY
MKRTDERIKKDIVDQLSWDSRIDASKVKVEVDNGNLELSGFVPTFSARRTVEEDVRGIPGVVSVDNRMVVNRIMTGPSDEKMHYTVDSVLSWSQDINAGNIRVAVDDGEVTLEGTVGTLWEKHRAEEIVSELKGIVGITNRLAVVPTKDVLDERIAENIVAALDRTGNVNVDSVDVKVENGIVTLCGTVRSWNARRTAYQAALFTCGVTNIHDDLAIER